MHNDFGVTFKDSYCVSLFNEVIKRSIDKYLICPKTAMDSVAAYSINLGHFDFIIASEPPAALIDTITGQKIGLICEI